MTGATKRQKTSRGKHVGDVMRDGTVYAGVSPSTGRPMYTTASDAALTLRWDEAMGYAATFNGHGHNDWRLPTEDELDVLFSNRAAIGGFNDSGSYFAGWHWSSAEHPGNANIAWLERFSDGGEDWVWKGVAASVRCVRLEPRP